MLGHLLLYRGDDGDLDEEFGAGHACLDAGAGGGVALGNPCVPDFVHGGEVFHVADVDGGGEHVLAVGAGLEEEVIDFVEHGGGLLGDVCGGVFTDLAAEVDGIVVDDDAAHALFGFLAVDGHGSERLLVLSEKFSGKTGVDSSSLEGLTD